MTAGNHLRARRAHDGAGSGRRAMAEAEADDKLARFGGQNSGGIDAKFIAEYDDELVMMHFELPWDVLTWN